MNFSEAFINLMRFHNLMKQITLFFDNILSYWIVNEPKENHFRVMFHMLPRKEFLKVFKHFREISRRFNRTERGV